VISPAAAASYELISSQEDLDRAVEEARSNGSFGLDTEFLRERTYRARLCLVQMASADSVVIVDATSRVDLASVAALIGDPDVRVITHAGRQDLDIVHDHFGVVPAHVFDVQIAAGFAGLGASLPYGRLVEALLGVSLPKGESYSDWCKRPLTMAQLRYAADDVRYLPAAANILERRLAEMGRLEWAHEEMRALERPETYVTERSELWRKVTGRGSLPPTKLPILRELAAWRDEVAAHRDIPRGWVMKDPTLVEVARRAPKSVASLQAIRGMNAREADRSGRVLIELVDRAKDAPPIQEQSPFSHQAQLRSRLLAGVADALVRARCTEARVAVELVATRSEIESVLANMFQGRLRPRDHRMLTGWRGKLVGEAVLALAEGKIALRATSSPPFIEEIEMEADTTARPEVIR
jgi:ribonuclease D